MDMTCTYYMINSTGNITLTKSTHKHSNEQLTSENF